MKDKCREMGLEVIYSKDYQDFFGFLLILVAIFLAD